MQQYDFQTILQETYRMLYLNYLLYYLMVNTHSYHTFNSFREYFFYKYVVNENVITHGLFSNLKHAT